MAKTTLSSLLELLAINGRDVNYRKREQLIENVIKQLYPSYWEQCMRQSVKKMIDDGLVKYADCDSLKIEHTADNEITVSYYVSQGCSGDWSVEYVHTRFMFYHLLRDFKLQKFK